MEFEGECVSVALRSKLSLLADAFVSVLRARCCFVLFCVGYILDLCDILCDTCMKVLVLTGHWGLGDYPTSKDTIVALTAD